VRDSNLETRNARLKLSPRGKPYWRVLEGGFHLGYRRVKKGGGSWIARRFLGKREQPYSEKRLGLADDLQDADGLTILSFKDAQARAGMVAGRAPQGYGTWRRGWAVHG